MAIDREKILQAAQKYVDKKRFDRAIAEYQKIVAQDPNDARTLLKIGDLQARMGAYAEAIATYDRVGQFYSTQGFALKAIAVYKQIRELIQKHVPQLADRYGHIVPKLAEIYTQLGLTSDALAAYDEVATRLQRSGRDRDAIDVFKKMVELDATNPLPHLRLAEACARVQSVEDAIASFWTAGELLIGLRRRDDALKVVDRILHFRADPKYARVAAELYLESGQQRDGLQALAKLQVCFQQDPKNLDTLALLARAFTVIGQGPKAIEVYKEMARLARDQDRQDLYEQLVQHLRSVAPHDEQVRALSALGRVSDAPSVYPASSSGAVSIRDDDLVSVPPTADASLQIVPPRAPLATEPSARSALTSQPDVVVVDEGQEAVEELVDPDSEDARAHARKAVVDAESFRKLRLYSKAIEALRIALEIDPRSLAIREKLREVLAEAGDRDGAIGEMITLAAIYIDRNETQPAEDLLYQVLEAEPGHPVAYEMLQQLGGFPADGEYRPEEGSTDQMSLEDALPADDFDPNAPLPSYDLEEVSAADALQSERAPPRAGLDAMDEPFPAADEPFAETEQPLPSFPLVAEEEDSLMVGLQGAEGATAELLEPLGDEPQLEPIEDEEAATGAPPAEMPAGVEEALEEAEFFFSRGLHEDARMILSDQLERTPHHPLLLEKIQEIDELIARSVESGARDRSQLRGLSEPAPHDRAFDIAASLELGDATDVTSPAGGGFASLAEEVDVDQVFAKFKEGVRAQVSESDSSTHYDLGVAYKEMGLVPDAIHEFELAARDPARECLCWAMVGMIQLEHGELDKAADAYVRGLHATQKSVEQEMNLYYDLGNVYEMKGNAEEALYYFQKIARRDPEFRDVRDRIQALQPDSKKEGPGSRKMQGDDEFDKVFDELFESK